MKRLSSRNKLAARPVSDVAAPLKPNRLSTSAKACSPMARMASFALGRAGRGPVRDRGAAL